MRARAAAACMAGALAAAAPGGGTAFIMPLPITDGKQIAQAKVVLGEVKKGLALAEQGTQTIRRVQGIVDGGILGVLPYVPLPEGIVRSAVLETARTGGVPWNALASGAVNVEGMSEAQRAGMRVAMRSMQRGSVDPMEAMSAVPLGSLSPEAQAGARTAMNAVRRGEIRAQDMVRHLPEEARHKAGLAMNPSEAMRWAAAQAGESVRGEASAIERPEWAKVPEWAQGATGAAQGAWRTVTTKVPAVGTYATQSAREPVRAALGAMSHKVHPALLGEVPGYGRLKALGGAPPGAQDAVTMGKIGRDVASSVGKDVWRDVKAGQEQREAQRRQDEWDRRSEQARHPHAPADVRRDPGASVRAGTPRGPHGDVPVEEHVEWAEQSGSVDWRQPPSETGGHPLTSTQRVEEGMEVVHGASGEVRSLVREAAGVLPERSVGRHLGRLEAVLGGVEAGTKVGGGQWGIAREAGRAAGVIGSGPAGRARQACAKIASLGVADCAWEGGVSGPVQRSVQGAIDSARWQDQVSESVAVGKVRQEGDVQDAAGVAEIVETTRLPAAEALAVDGRRQVAAAETGCAPAAGGPALPKEEVWPEPIATSGRPVLTDGLYLKAGEHASRSRVVRMALQRERSALVGWTAREAWAVAGAQITRDAAHRASLEALEERMGECEQLACDMRIVADGTRQAGLLSIQQAGLAMVALRMEIASAIGEHQLDRH